MHFSTVAKLVLFGIATTDLGTGSPFVSVGSWREKEIFFQGKDNLHIASRMPENNHLKAESCTIWAASELGLLMQIEYLHSQVFFFPILHVLFSISSFFGTGFHSCLQSHSHTDAIPCSKR